MTPIEEIRMAYKRSENRMSYDGPFTPTGKTGMAIAARNHCLLLDGDDDISTELPVLHLWSQSINRAAINTLFATDEVAQACLSSFRSRLWIDPTHLA